VMSARNPFPPRVDGPGAHTYNHDWPCVYLGPCLFSHLLPDALAGSLQRKCSPGDPQAKARFPLKDAGDPDAKD
jgi:hypothetical protein